MLKKGRLHLPSSMSFCCSSSAFLLLFLLIIFFMNFFLVVFLDFLLLICPSVILFIRLIGGGRNKHTNKQPQTTDSVLLPYSSLQCILGQWDEAKEREKWLSVELSELMDRKRKRFSKASRQQERMCGWKDEQKEVGTAWNIKVYDLKQATMITI